MLVERAGESGFLNSTRKNSDALDYLGAANMKEIQMTGPSVRRILLGGLAFLSMGETARAGDDTPLVWSGGGATANWTNPFNWLFFETPYDYWPYEARFASGSARTTNTVNEDVDVQRLVFTADLGSASSYTINGPGRIDIDEDLYNDMTSAQSVNAPVRFFGSSTTPSQLSNRRDDRVGGRITLADVAIFNSLDVHASSNGITIAGSVSGGRIRHHGPGTLTFTANSTHLGGITIKGGTVSYGFGAALGSLNNRITFDGSASDTPSLRRTSTGTLALPISIGGGGAWFPVGTGLTHTISAAITPTSSATGAAGLTKTEAGALILDGPLSYLGSTVVAGGALRANQPLPATDVRVESGAALELPGNTHIISSLNGSGTIRLSNNAALVVGQGLETANGSGSFFGSIEGAGRLEKRGTQLLALWGNSSYTGGTIIASGELRASNQTTGSATGTGSVTVRSGAVLSGTGRVTGPVTIESGGILSPGSTYGDLDTGSVTLNAGAVYRSHVRAGTTNSGYVDAAGTVSIAGATLRITPESGFAPALDTVRRLLEATQINGVFSTVEGVLIPGITDRRFAVRYVDGTDDLVEAVAARPGDANLDQTVNFSDLLLLAQNYGTPGIKTWASGDFDGDGSASFPDLLTLAQFYTSPATLQSDWAVAQAVVPEPATLSLLLVSGLLLGRRR
jgi:autotransporter-associated beta strand protein